MTREIVRAHASDFAEVLALLRAVNLPIEGVAEHFAGFFVAQADGDLIGCVGQERYGDVALLRSLAVAPAQQGAGLGRELTSRLLADARESGVREVVLLTTTAAEFFQSQFGFAPVERKNYDEVLNASPEWKLPRCSAAVCLRLRLDEQ